MEMKISELEEALKVVGSCVPRVKWRLKPSAKRRLEIDILALCTGLRPVVMVDYGGKMPELQDHLCSVLKLSQKESPILEPLRVMVIEDMIYLLHSREFAEYIRSSLNSEIEIIFVDLEQDPPKMVINAEQNSIAAQFKSVQRFFSPVYSPNGTGEDRIASDDGSSNIEQTASQYSEFSDLSGCMEDSPITIPTLNGWLLGYPVIYLFGKEHIPDAVYTLSTKSLHLFRILICRNDGSSKGRTRQEELMSFTVPYDLSMGGKKEPWAEAFLVRMLGKLERCKHVWRDLQLEVSECYPQAIVL